MTSVRLRPLDLPAAFSLRPVRRCTGSAVMQTSCSLLTVLLVVSSCGPEREGVDPFSELRKRRGGTDQLKDEAREVDKTTFFLENPV